jgi:cytochrome b6-f complex iron-sulfur subunit
MKKDNMKKPITGKTKNEESSSRKDISRRSFLRSGVGIAGLVYIGASFYPVYRYLVDPAEKAAAEAAVKEIDLPGMDTLPKGASSMFRFAGKPGLLIHHEEGEWTAFSAVCTHLACTVEFQAVEKRIHCACHGGTYDMKTGKNIAGPPPRPLTKYNVEVLDGKVKISRT